MEHVVVLGCEPGTVECSAGGGERRVVDEDGDDLSARIGKRVCSRHARAFAFNVSNSAWVTVPSSSNVLAFANSLAEPPLEAATDWT